ncbi:hypothetical protein [Phreatobacter sp.]|uniref:hypothetical protein n=1 Tax=Phreatobacter sp. TaxID=1966341 RepID=UPI003F71988E
MTRSRLPAIAAAVLLAALAGLAPSAAQTEDYGSWPLLTDPFPSTGGGGIMIGGYNPVVEGRLCRTAFTATTPNGTIYRNTVEFDAVEAQGGILCTNGRWRAADGSASGTTPFRIFIRENVKRMAPP